MRIPALLTLLRPPNVFTAFADAVAGLLVIRAAGVEIKDVHLALIAVSGLLYLSGIVLNDVFDRDIDARERPDRPIPSGAVSIELAVTLGAGLMASGVALAFCVSIAAGAVAASLAGAILAYDVGLKNTPAGPVAMGACRGMNFCLGMSPAIAIGVAWSPVAIAGPVFLGLYVACLTYVARDEVQGNTERRARAGLAAMATLPLAALLLIAVGGVSPSAAAWVWFAGVVLLGWRNWRPVWRHHDGPTTGRAIGGGILLVPVLDATVCALAGEPFWAVSVAALAVPAVLLKQWFSPT